MPDALRHRRVSRSVVRRTHPDRHGTPADAVALLRAWLTAPPPVPRAWLDADEALRDAVGRIDLDDTATIALTSLGSGLGRGADDPVPHGLVRSSPGRTWTLMRWPSCEAAMAWVVAEADAGHMPPRLPPLPDDPSWRYRPRGRR